jgi:hypothetical protein
MSAGKHTPGPWKASRPDSLKGDWTCCDDAAAQSSWLPVADAAGNAVALVVDSSMDFTDRTSFDADARLVAAAPDLLEALQTFVALSTTFSSSIKMLEEIASQGGRGAPLAKAVVAARSAIAKATGQAA